MTPPFPWQAAQWGHLWSMRRHDRLPHALLLASPGAFGGSELARAFARALLCLSPDGDGVACGSCRACTLMHAGSHPEYWLCVPEGDAKAIRIEQLRALTRLVSLKPQLSPLKVAIIDPADGMSPYAMNSLLKTLEEPPLETVLVLVSECAATLPATVRSRCQRIDLQPAARATALAWLAERVAGGGDLDLALRLAGEAPLAALRLIEEGELAGPRNGVEDLVGLRSGTADPIELAEAWSKRDPATTLGWLLSAIEDLIKIRAAPQSRGIVHLHAQEGLEALARGMDHGTLFAVYDGLVSALRAFKGAGNLAPLNLFEEFTIKWCTPTTADTRPHVRTG